MDDGLLRLVLTQALTRLAVIEAAMVSPITPPAGTILPAQLADTEASKILNT